MLFRSHIFTKKIYRQAERIKFKIENFFLVTAIIMGCLFAVLLPPGQVPDEPAHYEMMVMEFGIPSHYYDEIYKSFGDLDFINVMKNPQRKQSVEQLNEYSTQKFSGGGEWQGIMTSRGKAVYRLCILLALTQSPLSTHLVILLSTLGSRYSLICCLVLQPAQPCLP